jgi:hypothetical protein
MPRARGGPIPAATVPLYPLGSVTATTDQPWLVITITTTAGYAADNMGISILL